MYVRKVSSLWRGKANAYLKLIISKLFNNPVSNNCNIY